MQNKGEIVINGRRLGLIKKWIFNKSSSELYKFGKNVYLSSVMLVASITALLITLGYTYVWFFGVFLSILLVSMQDKVLNDRFYIRRRDFETDSGEEKEQLLQTSNFITYDNFSEMMQLPWYNEGDVEIKILKNSSGHKAIVELQQKAAKDVATMVPYATNLTQNMIENVFEHYKKTGEEIKLDRAKLNLQDIKIDRLREYYAKANGIPLNNEFGKKTVKLKSREELVNFIEDRFVKEA